MDIATLRTFFMWCTILNGGMLVISSLGLTFAGNLIYRVHNRWFKMSREAFNIVVYSFIGFYKIILMVFCLVPYVVLVIMG
ncbi:MAG: hypothetical protein KAR44_02890 [Candidatus Aegiribacteria sp.]|nr:hypothetical protein [Candidatus Aegiribacteria sp.]